MRASQSLRRVFGIAVCVAVLQPAYALSPDARLAVAEIAPGVFVHQGAYEETSASNNGDIANIGFIVGGRCVAVIDTGGSVETGKALHRAIRAVTPLPICYVINTHVHPDHVFGNAAFLEDHPVFIAHVKMPRALAARAEHYLNTGSRALGRTLPHTVIVFPTRTIAAESDIDLGGRILRLRPYPTAHTDNDLTVFDVNTHTLWLADLLFLERIPALDGSLKGWLAVLDEVRGAGAARIVPGHGPPSAPWPQALAPEERYLQALLHDTQQVLADGGTLEEAVARVDYSEKDRWALFDDYHRRNVTAAYAELEWDE